MDPQMLDLRQFDFCNTFWGQTTKGGVENVLENVKVGSKVLQELARWYQERASIEEEYGKRLAKLSRQRLGYAEFGTLRTALDRCRTELAKTAQCHQNLSTVMGKELGDGIEEFLKRREGLRKGPQNSIEKLHKTRKQQEEAALKSRRKFEEFAVSVNELTAQSSLTQGKEYDKLSVKLDRAKGNADGNQQEYENACKVLKDTTIKWNTEWKGFLDLAQDLEESRRDFIKASLWEYANAVSTVCVVDDESCERVRTSLEATHTPLDLHTFVSQKGTGPEIYDPVPYVDFAAGESTPAVQTFRIADYARASTHPRIRPVPSSIQDLVGAIQTRPNTPGEEIPSAPPSPSINTSKTNLGLPGKEERDEQRKRTLEGPDANGAGSGTVGSMARASESTSSLNKLASPSPKPANSEVTSPKLNLSISIGGAGRENGVEGEGEGGVGTPSGAGRKFTASAFQKAAPIPADRRPAVNKSSTFVAEPDPLQAALEKLKNSSNPASSEPPRAGSISAGAGKVPQPRDTLESLLVNMAAVGGSPSGTLQTIVSPTVMQPVQPLLKGITTPRGSGNMQAEQEAATNGPMRTGTPLSLNPTPNPNGQNSAPPPQERRPSLSLPGTTEQLPASGGGRPPSRSGSPSAVAVPASHMFTAPPPALPATSAPPAPPIQASGPPPPPPISTQAPSQPQSPPQMMGSPNNQFSPSGFNPYPPNQFNPMQQNQYGAPPPGPGQQQPPQPQRQQTGTFPPSTQAPYGQTPPLQMPMPPHMPPQMMGGPISPQTPYGFHPMMGMYGGQPGFMPPGGPFGFQQPPQQQQQQQQQQPPPQQQQPPPARQANGPPPTGQYTEDGKPILFYVQAIYDYNPQEDQDLQFSAEDVIAVTHTDETGWWEGVKIGLDQSGSFPSNFVKLLE